MKICRNSHISPTENSNLPPMLSAGTRVPPPFGEEVIVIDDDDEEDVKVEASVEKMAKETDAEGDVSAVESLGEEMLELMGSKGGLKEDNITGRKYYGGHAMGWGDNLKGGKASKQPVPATPRTFLKNLNFQQQAEDDSKEKEEDQWTVLDELGQVDCGSEKGESTVSGEEGGNDTIVIEDDTLEEGQLEDSIADEVVLEKVLWKESPLSGANMQEVVTRYPSASEDFIPIESPRQVKRKAANMQRREMNRGRNMRGRGGVTFSQPPGPRFRMEQPGGFNRERGRGVHSQPPRHQFRMNQPGGSGLDFNFGGFSTARGGVFRFGAGIPGKRAGQTQGLQVSKAPTISEGKEGDPRVGLRPIVIDGSNVAMAHGKNKVFSAKGIKIVADHFKQSGHSKIVAFVPQFRKKSGQVADRSVLEGLEEEGVVVFTPSREVGVERITSYDDTFVLDYAAKHGGVVITRDNYRDLAHSKPEWLEVVKKRILMPTFVGEDEVMWPHDPLGRGGLTLDQFLSF